MNEYNTLIENELLDIIYSYRKAQLLYVAARLGISDILAKGPKSINEIAEITDSNPDAVYRILRALSGFGIYNEIPQKRFELTTRGQYLQKDFPSPVRVEAIMRMEEYNWKPWGDIFYSVKTGKSAFENVFGMNLFEYLSNNPKASKTFNEAMEAGTYKNAIAFVETYDFTPYNVIADIGGNKGDLLKQILSKHKSKRGVLFDLPSVIQKTDVSSFEPDIYERLEIIKGSFFEQIPENCDLYIFKRILHDWDDKHSIKILQNCHQSCPKGSKVLLLERVLDRQNSNFSDVAINDIHMLLQTIGGRERTQEEYFDLLSLANFEPLSATPEYVEAIKR